MTWVSPINISGGNLSHFSWRVARIRMVSRICLSASGRRVLKVLMELSKFCMMTYGVVHNQVVKEPEQKAADQAGHTLWNRTTIFQRNTADSFSCKLILQPERGCKPAEAETPKIWTKNAPEWHIKSAHQPNPLKFGEKPRRPFQNMAKKGS